MRLVWRGFALLLSAAPVYAAVTYVIDTAAGSDLVGDGGLAGYAQISSAHGVAVDGQGNLFIADTDNHRIRKVTPGGVISTLAGTGHAGYSGDGALASLAQLNSPYGLAVDSAGSVYVADYGNHRVRKISPDGVITTVAGTGWKGSDGDGGPAVSAQLMSPRNLAFDSVGNLYISEFEGHRVRRVARDGTISTVAGTGVAGLNIDPKSPTMPAIAAQLAYPAGLAVDAYDNLYIADSGNDLLRRVSAGTIVTFIDGRSDPASLMYAPAAVAIDKLGFLYIADATAFVRQFFNGQWRSVAGTGDAGYSGDGGLAVSAQLTGPHDLAFNSKGELYIADGAYVRKVSAGAISTVAGNAYAFGIGDGLPATLAQLKLPAGLAMDGAGNLLIADGGTARVRRLNAGDGTILTIAGNGHPGYYGDGGPAVAAQLFSPGGAAADGVGNVYIADTKNNRVRRVMPSGFLLTAAGNGAAASGAENTYAPLAPLNQPRGVALDAAGNLYIADTGNHRVVRITLAGTLATVAGNGSPGWAGDNGRAAVAQLNAPGGLAFDPRGNLYIADTFNHLIRKVTPAGMITTVAGSGAPGYSGDGGPATTATLSFPAAVAVDAAGTLYIADTWNHRIRMVDTAGVIHTIAGSDTPGYKGDGGLAPAAQLDFPAGIAVDPNGVVYFSDSFNNRVRKLTPQAAADLAAPIVEVAVVNTASLQPGPVAGGEMATVLAPGIGPEIGVSSHVDANGLLETTLAETQVQFDGVPAPLFAVASGRFDLQIPYGVGGSTRMEIFFKGVSRVRLAVPVAESAPGIFAGRIFNQDGTANSTSNPAARDSLVTVYATGEGALDPAGVSGKTAAPPLGRPVLPVDLKIGGNSCDLVSVAQAAGMVGMLQITARVPSGFVPTGNLPIVLTVGSASSQAGVSIAVD